MSKTKNKGGRPSGPKDFAHGTMTAAAFRNWIMRGLRQLTIQWPPKNAAKKKAWVKRGFYRCEGCGKTVPASKPGFYKSGKRAGQKKRIANVHVDHHPPVIDPEVGFTSWDETIERMFCEVEGLRLFCLPCHKAETAREREIQYKRLAREKSDD